MCSRVISWFGDRGACFRGARGVFLHLGEVCCVRLITCLTLITSHTRRILSLQPPAYICSRGISCAVFRSSSTNHNQHGAAVGSAARHERVVVPPILYRFSKSTPRDTFLGLAGIYRDWILLSFGPRNNHASTLWIMYTSKAGTCARAGRWLPRVHGCVSNSDCEGEKSKRRKDLHQQKHRIVRDESEETNHQTQNAKQQSKHENDTRTREDPRKSSPTTIDTELGRMDRLL